MEKFGVNSKFKDEKERSSLARCNSDIISSDPHLKVLWPKSVPALQKILYEALDQEALTMDDVRSLVGGVSTISTSPAVRAQMPTNGYIQLESYKARLSVLYPGLNFSGPSNFSTVSSVALVSETDEPWHTIMTVDGVSYYMPTSSMDVIYPIEVMETFGVSAMTNRFNKGCYVVKKAQLDQVQRLNRSVVMNKLESSTEYDIPVKFDVQSLKEGNISLNSCTADKYAVGVAREDGIIDLPYEKLTCAIPSVKGEVYLFGQCKNGGWYPIDVVSKNRNLRMSILKGIYGTCEGKVPMIYSTAGQLIISAAGGPVELLRSIKLNTDGRVTFKGDYTDEAVLWLVQTFEGCAFDFEEFFGYTSMPLRTERIDCGAVNVESPNLHYDITVEEVMRQNVTFSGDWSQDIYDMTGIVAKNRDELMTTLVYSTKYVYIEGELYDEVAAIEMTPEICHEIWFKYLGLNVRKEGGRYVSGPQGKKRNMFITVEIGGFLYINHNDISFRVKNLMKESLKVVQLTTTTKTSSEEFGNFSDLKIEHIPQRLGGGDWKSLLNHELQIRGLPHVKYEHDIQYVGGVPRFRSFVMFKGRKICADDFQPSKKATEKDVASKVFQIVTDNVFKDPI